MKKHDLLRVSCAALLTALCTSALAADDTPMTPHRFLFGSTPTDYQWFAHPQTNAPQDMQHGVQGPIRTEMMDNESHAQPGSGYSDNMNQPTSRSMWLPSQEQPTQYPR